MANPGIDYSGGTANFDEQTGIHYGVIPICALSEWAWDEFESYYGEPTCPQCGGELGADFKEDGETYRSEDFCENCGEDIDPEDQYPEDPLGFTYEGDGFILTMGVEDQDIFVIKSLYYTYAQFCSPCAPGAGYLLNPCEDGPKTYCLDKSWFSKENPCPYPYWSVETGDWRVTV